MAVCHIATLENTTSPMQDSKWQPSSHKKSVAESLIKEVSRSAKATKIFSSPGITLLDRLDEGIIQRAIELDERVCKNKRMTLENSSKRGKRREAMAMQQSEPIRPESQFAFACERSNAKKTSSLIACIEWRSFLIFLARSSLVNRANASWPSVC